MVADRETSYLLKGLGESTASVRLNLPPVGLFSPGVYHKGQSGDFADCCVTSFGQLTTL